MQIDKNFILQRPNRKPILIDAFYSENKPKQPIILFCHGYKGFKDWGAWDLMGKAIAKNGFCFIKFNFSHNGGTMENPIDFPDLEAFGNNNYSKELDDLNDVLDWIQNHYKNNTSVDTSSICLVGHSRGGGISVLKASTDRRITKLITLASVSDFGSRFGTEEDIKEWQEKGVKYVVNGRTKQEMPHYYQFYEDFKANEDKLYIETAAKAINIPFLIIHGNKDSSVSINAAHDLHSWNPKSKLDIINDADHVFNIRHPWEKNNLSTELTEVVESIVDFNRT